LFCFSIFAKIEGVALLLNLMKNIKTAIAYVKDYTTTGAISKSSKWVEDGVTRFVDKNQKQVIVEYGAGHGNITEVILKKMHPDSKLISFEINEDFCEELLQINDKRLTIVSDSAEKIMDFVDGENSVDTVISSLPITFIPEEVVNEIYRLTQLILKKEAHMTQWLYTPLHVKIFKHHFSKVSTETGFGIPMEFIKVCKK
jgi:phospholipid N-methyltransferase